MKIFNTITRAPTKIFCSFSVCLFLVSVVISSAAPVYALSKEQKNLYQKNINYYEYNVCGGEEEVDSAKLDLEKIVKDNGGFSATVYTSSGEKIGDYKGAEMPAVVASTLKPILVNVAIENGAPISTSDIKATLDIRSDNDAANRIIRATGISAINSKLESLNYKNTKVNNLYNSAPVNGGNKTSSDDIGMGIINIIKGSGSKYSAAQDALKSSATANGGKDYFGNDVEMSKWGGTSEVSSVAVLTKDIEGKKYVIATYVNQGDAKDKVRKIISDTQNALKTSGGGSGNAAKGVSYDANRATIDTDGSGGSGGSSTFQSQTNLRTNGKLNDDSTSLNASKINFYVLYGAWAQKRDISLGDIAKVEYKGKTSYAVFGDNHGVGSPDSEWSEISSALARSFGGSGDGATGTLTGKIKYTIYPGSHKKLDVKPSASVGVAATALKMNELQGKIDELGTQLSGGTSIENNDSCCLTENTSTNLPGRNNKEKVWNYLVGELKLNDKQAAGVMGNMEQESNFNPKAVNPTSGAYGIAQWYAGRKTALQNFAQEKGKSISNLGVQLEYLKKELEGNYKSSVYEPLKNANSVAEATRIWLEKFEIPCTPGSGCDAEMNIRLPKAQDYFDKYGNGSTDTSSSSSDDSPACSEGTNSGGVDGVSWPVKKSFWNQHQDWFTKPHHDYASADIPVPSRTRVFSMTEGKVILAGNNGGCGFGVFIKYQSDVEIGYCHGTPGSIKVETGDSVTPGQLIMLSDNTGSSTGPHLHVQIKVNGELRCPQKAFKDLGANKAVDFKGLPSSGCSN